MSAADVPEHLRKRAEERRAALAERLFQKVDHKAEAEEDAADPPPPGMGWSRAYAEDGTVRERIAVRLSGFPGAVSAAIAVGQAEPVHDPDDYAVMARGYDLLLTSDEHRFLALTGELAGLLHRIIYNGTGFAPWDAEPAAMDWNELAASIHVLQRTVLAQAAARAFPDRYRLLGARPIPGTPGVAG